MKETLENFIVKCLDKLDATTLIILIPCSIIIYVCVFVPNEEIEKMLGIEDKIENKQHTIIQCPYCKKSFIMYEEFKKDSLK